MGTTLKWNQHERRLGHRFRTRRTLRVLALFSCYCVSIYSAHAQQRPTDTQVKAAYLFNFGKFVRWRNPAPGGNTFTICVVGKNPFGPALETTVAGEKLDGQTVVISSFSTLPDSARCRILFVSNSEESHLPSIFALAKRQQALTVSDIPGFAKHGGMIEFVTQADRIRFEVNLSPVNDAGLSVSSELLKVATKVRGMNEARVDQR